MKRVKGDQSTSSVADTTESSSSCLQQNTFTLQELKQKHFVDKFKFLCQNGNFRCGKENTDPLLTFYQDLYRGSFDYLGLPLGVLIEFAFSTKTTENVFRREKFKNFINATMGGKTLECLETRWHQYFPALIIFFGKHKERLQNAGEGRQANIYIDNENRIILRARIKRFRLFDNSGHMHLCEFADSITYRLELTSEGSKLLDITFDQGETNLKEALLTENPDLMQIFAKELKEWKKKPGSIVKVELDTPEAITSFDENLKELEPLHQLIEEIKDALQKRDLKEFFDQDVLISILTEMVMCAKNCGDAKAVSKKLRKVFDNEKRRICAIPKKIEAEVDFNGDYIKKVIKQVMKSSNEKYHGIDTFETKASEQNEAVYRKLHQDIPNEMKNYLSQLVSAYPGLDKLKIFVEIKRILFAQQLQQNNPGLLANIKRRFARREQQSLNDSLLLLSQKQVDKIGELLKTDRVFSEIKNAKVLLLKRLDNLEKELSSDKRRALLECNTFRGGKSGLDDNTFDEYDSIAELAADFFTYQRYLPHLSRQGQFRHTGFDKFFQNLRVKVNQDSPEYLKEIKGVLSGLSNLSTLEKKLQEFKYYYNKPRADAASEKMIAKGRAWKFILVEGVDELETHEKQQPNEAMVLPQTALAAIKGRLIEEEKSRIAHLLPATFIRGRMSKDRYQEEVEKFIEKKCLNDDSFILYFGTSYFDFDETKLKNISASLTRKVLDYKTNRFMLTVAERKKLIDSIKHKVLNLCYSKDKKLYQFNNKEDGLLWQLYKTIVKEQKFLEWCDNLRKEQGLWPEERIGALIRPLKKQVENYLNQPRYKIDIANTKFEDLNPVLIGNHKVYTAYLIHSILKAFNDARNDKQGEVQINTSEDYTRACALINALYDIRAHNPRIFEDILPGFPKSNPNYVDKRVKFTHILGQEVRKHEKKLMQTRHSIRPWYKLLGLGLRRILSFLPFISKPKREEASVVATRIATFDEHLKLFKQNALKKIQRVRSLEDLKEVYEKLEVQRNDFPKKNRADLLAFIDTLEKIQRTKLETINDLESMTYRKVIFESPPVGRHEASRRTFKGIEVITDLANIYAKKTFERRLLESYKFTHQAIDEIKVKRRKYSAEVEQKARYNAQNVQRNEEASLVGAESLAINRQQIIEYLCEAQQCVIDQVQQVDVISGLTKVKHDFEFEIDRLLNQFKAEDDKTKLDKINLKKYVMLIVNEKIKERRIALKEVEVEKAKLQQTVSLLPTRRKGKELVHRRRSPKSKSSQEQIDDIYQGFLRDLNRCETTEQILTLLTLVASKIATIDSYSQLENIDVESKLASINKMSAQAIAEFTTTRASTSQQAFFSTTPATTPAETASRLSFKEAQRDYVEGDSPHESPTNSGHTSPREGIVAARPAELTKT